MSATANTTPLASQSPPHGIISMNFREFVSSALGIGIGLYAYYSAGGGPQGLRNAAIGFGFGVLIAAALQAHGNPYISIASWIRNRSTNQLTHRLPGQIIAWTLVPFFGQLIYQANVPKVNYGVATPPPGTPWMLTLLVQLGAAFLLAAIAVWVTEITVTKLAGLIIGTTLGLLVYFTQRTGGGGVNAAREIGPALWAWNSPYGSVDMVLFWAALIGGILGAVAAGLVLQKIRR